MIGVSTSPFNISMLRKRNVWYTIADGNWSDPKIWMSNGTKKHTVPQADDDVYVNHSIMLNSNNIMVRNLFIAGSINANSSIIVILTINGNFQVCYNGHISLLAQSHNLILNGYNNVIPYDSFDAGNLSTVTYNAHFDQFILKLPYHNIYTSGGKKYQLDNINIGGNFNMQSDYECGIYNLTVAGNSTIGVVGSYTLYKNGSGNILFIGNVDFEGNTDFSVGNPNIEFRNGLSIHTFNFTSGTGTVTFSTNSQTLSASAYLGGSWHSPIVIEGAIALTLTGSGFSTFSTINGTTTGSTFNNDGVLRLYNSTLPMSIGMFNYMHDPNSTIGFYSSGNYALPYTTYANLIVDGVGTKTLSGNTIINKNFSSTNDLGASYFQLNGKDLTVKGNFLTQGGLLANSFCNILIEGSTVFTNGLTAMGIDLTGGNPNIEFKGGFSNHTSSTYTGNGVFKFSTNNQTFDMSINNGGSFDCSILISGNITLTWINGSSNTSYYINGTINGDNPSSTFLNKGVFGYTNGQQPMQTGIIDSSSFNNTFIYSRNGNQDITSTIYKNLTLSVGGVKKLQGNVSVLNTYNILAPASLDQNGYTLSNS